MTDADPQKPFPAFLWHGLVRNPHGRDSMMNVWADTQEEARAMIEAAIARNPYGAVLVGAPERKTPPP